MGAQGPMGGVGALAGSDKGAPKQSEGSAPIVKSTPARKKSLIRSVEKS
jgi:hypothetical protein